MSSVLAAAESSPAEPIPFEQRLFRLSPGNTLMTTALIFALAAGSFFLVAWLTGYPVLATNSFVLAPRAVPPVVISLLLATALGMRRYVDVRQAADAPAFAAIISGTTVSTSELLKPTSSTGMAIVSWIGGAVGAALTFLTVPESLLHTFPAIFAWFAVFDIILCVLLARGVTSARRSSARFKRIIEQGVRIELLKEDKLDVIGRQCARNALVWLTNAAVICLFFIGGNSSVTTFILLVVCIGIGLWMFLRPMERVHRRIRAAKSVELDRIRDEIAEVSEKNTHDVSAATRLQGLIAYEGRIQAVREWPFDHSTLVRVGAYVLIPALPWFGKALALSNLLHRIVR